MNNSDFTLLTVKDFLSYSDKYHIPIYQRNYDWGERETLQLIEDISDYASIRKTQPYYIGSVVVFHRRRDVGNEYYETIDGQQRLTTLTIMVYVLKSMKNPGVRDKLDWFNKANLSYDHRKEADEAIQNLGDEILSEKPAGANISEVYRIIKKNIERIVTDKGLTMCEYVDYLMDKVKIMRIPVPEDTELNHYFEIMNSRGEQLEKHEVLKAHLMSYIEKDPENRMEICLFNDIWEACSDMGAYVQMKFRPALRDVLFSDDWDSCTLDDFDSLLLKYKDIDEKHDKGDADTDEYPSRTLDDLFVDASKNIHYDLPAGSRGDSDSGNERFMPIINFPNFLLQTLKVMYRFQASNCAESVDDPIKLDDKRLIEIFMEYIKQQFKTEDEKKKFTKDFIMTLLRMRFLFDKYVIKRENYNNRSGWSLKRLKKYEKNNVSYVDSFSGQDSEDSDDGVSRDIRMLEAMFHVSAPTQAYKYWLNALLYHVYGKDRIDPADMRDRLYQLACAYMLDRYLTDRKSEFEEIIYINKSVPKNGRPNWDMLDKGCDVENFIFNFYDYITWETEQEKYRDFEFTYRASVEHFYPQTPQTGYPNLPDDILNSFGNLCLISSGMNSKFSNNMPVAKCENFGRDEVTKELSLKLNEMMDYVRSHGNRWSDAEIVTFRKIAVDKMIRALGTWLSA